MTALRTALALLVPGALVAACHRESVVAPRGPQFHLTIDRVSYAPGDSAHGALYNDGATPLMGYSFFCSGAIEQRSTSGSWSAAWSWAYPCAAIAYSLAPGDSVGWRLTLPASLASGTYRAHFFGIPDFPIASTIDDRASTPPFGIAAATADRR